MLNSVVKGKAIAQGEISGSTTVTCLGSFTDHVKIKTNTSYKTAGGTTPKGGRRQNLSKVPLWARV